MSATGRLVEFAASSAVCPLTKVGTFRCLRSVQQGCDCLLYNRLCRCCELPAELPVDSRRSSRVRREAEVTSRDTHRQNMASELPSVARLSLHVRVELLPAGRPLCATADFDSAHEARVDGPG